MNPTDKADKDNRSTYSASSGVDTGPGTPVHDGKDSQSQCSSRSSSRKLRFEEGASSGQRSVSPLDQSLARLLSQMPVNVRKFSWELRHEIAKLLNPLKEPSGNDWRKVASRLAIVTDDIILLQGKENPTLELLNLCTNTTSEEFFGVIVGIQRFDVISDLLEFLRFSFKDDVGTTLPTQESLDDSTSSGYDLPLDESFSGSDRSGLSRTPSEHKEDDEKDDLDRFITEESRQFWCNIPGGYYQHKRWKDFYEAMKKACPEEIQKGCVAKFLCKVFKISYDNRDSQDISLVWFCRLVAWFGPIQPGKEGCLHKIRELMTKSISKDVNGKQSWFAGHMDETESERLLRGLTPGHFLIRFSSSRADDGVFVLAVQTRDNGVVQIQIEASPKEGILQLGGQVFTNLMEIVSTLRNNVLLEECRQLLINPCPNLPLNAMFTGYCPGGARKKREGRGRGMAAASSGH